MIINRTSCGAQRSIAAPLLALALGWCCTLACKRVEAVAPVTQRAVPLMAAKPAPKVGAIVSETRTLTNADGVTVTYEIGTLYVPENRHKPTSRTIGVGFARIRAPAPTGAPPVFWLPGGPGFAVLGAFDQSDEAGRSRLKSWIALGAVGDVVVVEQRGYTSRGEMLSVETDAYPLDRPATIEQAKSTRWRRLARRWPRSRTRTSLDTISARSPTTWTSCARRSATAPSPCSAAASGRSGASL